MASHKPRNFRPRVEELVREQAVHNGLRRHIGAELKRRSIVGGIDPDDIFQETLARGGDPNKPGPTGDVLLWLKRIATNCLLDGLRKDNSRSRRNFDGRPENTSDEPVNNSAEILEVIEAAKTHLTAKERRFFQLCLEGLSPEALASASELPNAKSARDAKYRLFQKLRELRVALLGE